MRLCFKCKEEKPFSEFYKSTDRKLQRECKACTRARRSEWWKSEAGRKSSRASKLKARFGITAAQYETMLAAQHGCCAICGADKSCLGHKLAVDHNHETNAIRGLLCKSCNVGIGNLQDNAALCIKAAEYLNSFNSTL